MTKDILKIITVVGTWACMIYAGATWGMKAGGVVAFALFLTAINAAMNIVEFEEEMEADEDAEEEA